MPELGTPGDLGYPDHLLVPGLQAGAQDPVTGIYTPGTTATPLYDGPADLQDAGAMLNRQGAGRLVEAWEVQAFLPPAAEAAVATLRPNLPCTATWASGRKAAAEITKVRQFDGAVELSNLVLV